jgi:hypothetical protein
MRQDWRALSFTDVARPARDVDHVAVLIPKVHPLTRPRHAHVSFLPRRPDANNKFTASVRAKIV